jgi:hypothetical protein
MRTCRSVVDMPNVKSLTYAIAVIAFFLPIGANAFVGAVKVACPGNDCDSVNLGQICDTMAPGAPSDSPARTLRLQAGEPPGPAEQQPAGPAGPVCHSVR